jgi:hypothetical protein
VKPYARGGSGPKRRSRAERCETPGRPAVSREASRFRHSQSPGAPPGSGNVGSTSGRKGKRGSDREAGPKVAEENALEGRRPRRARFGRPRLRAEACRAPSRLESTSGVAAVRFLVGWAEKRQERRGPERDTADREEQGPEGRTPRTLWRSTGRHQARRGASRREGSETLRAEGAGVWKPRVIRILRAGMCRRATKPQESRSPVLRDGGGDHGTCHSRGAPSTRLTPTMRTSA